MLALDLSIDHKPVSVGVPPEPYIELGVSWSIGNDFSRFPRSKYVREEIYRKSCLTAE